MTVSQLVEDCRNGRAEAWTSLVQLIRPRAVNWAHQFLRDRDSAEDVVQDSLLLASRHLKELRNAQAFESWFFQIVKTQAFRFLKKEQKCQTELITEVSDNSNLESTELLKMDFERAFSQLPQELQQVFLLAEIHQWAINEVAGFLSIPSGTVKSRLSRARQQIQAFFRSEEKGESRANSQSISWEALLELLRDKADIDHQLIKDTLATTWATIKNMKFELVRGWHTEGADDKQQLARYTWMAPNWLRIDTEHTDVGKVSTVIHGKRMRTWFESSNKIQQTQLSNTIDPQFILAHLWKELLLDEKIVILPSDEHELWHVWSPITSEMKKDEQAGVHFWINSSNGVPIIFEWWTENGCVFREQVKHVEYNVHVTRRMFDLPTDAPKMNLLSIKEILGGIPTKVVLTDAIKACPFPLMGLDMNVVASHGIKETIEVLSYYKGTELSVRYGPPTRSRESLQGKPVVMLGQAEQTTDAIFRHWGLNSFTEPQHELGGTAKSRVYYSPKRVVAFLFWENNGRPYMLTGFGLTVEDLVALASHVHEIHDGFSKI